MRPSDCGRTDDQIRAEFQRRRKRQIAISAFGIVSFAMASAGMLIAAVLSATSHASTPLYKLVALPIGYWVVAMGVFTLLSCLNWRCPACQKMFGMSPPTRHCSKCGTPLSDDEAAKFTCPRCRRLIYGWLTFSFCTKCGARLSDG